MHFFKGRDRGALLACGSVRRKVALAQNKQSRSACSTMCRAPTRRTPGPGDVAALFAIADFGGSVLGKPSRAGER